MDITGHFESGSCVIEVDGSATLAQVKGKLVAEFGVPHARNVGVRMRGGGDIGNDDLRICDTEMDEGCVVELYCTGANITPGVVPGSQEAFVLTLSPCDRYLAVMRNRGGLSIFDTATHECLCHFPCKYTCSPSFSPCSEWISCVNDNMNRAEVYDVKTGTLKHSFGDEGDERWATAWSPCGTKLLSWCRKGFNPGLQVWDIATGVVVHTWSHIVKCADMMVVAGDRVATFGETSKDVTIWDYTTGAEVLVLACLSDVEYVALTPNHRFIAVSCSNCVRVWNIETGECVFEDISVCLPGSNAQDYWTDVAVSNDVVAVYSSSTLCVWSISTGEQLLRRKLGGCDSFGLAISSCGGVMMYGRDKGVAIVDISHLS